MFIVFDLLVDERRASRWWSSRSRERRKASGANSRRNILPKNEANDPALAGNGRCGRGAQMVSHGRGARRNRGQARRSALPDAASAPGCRKSRSSARRIAWWADFGISRKSGWSARCCWVCTTRKGCSITWDSRRRFIAEDRAALTKKLEKLIKPPGFTGKAPGGLSRWSTKHSMEWQPLDAEACGRSAVRPFHRRTISAWHEVFALAAGESAADCTMKQVKRENRSALKLL